MLPEGTDNTTTLLSAENYKHAAPEYDWRLLPLRVPVRRIVLVKLVLARLVKKELADLIAVEG
jgi:hypothetical protein